MFTSMNIFTLYFRHPIDTITIPPLHENAGHVLNQHCLNSAINHLSGAPVPVQKHKC